MITARAMNEISHSRARARVRRPTGRLGWKKPRPQAIYISSFEITRVEDVLGISVSVIIRSKELLLETQMFKACKLGIS